METLKPGSRHGMLFELLRQQVVSDASSRMAAHPEHGLIEAMHADRFLSRALNSWNLPEPEEEPEVGAARQSAPKAAGYHEFFRAIRAG